MLEWNPHDKAKEQVGVLNLKGIKEPPCKGCKYFTPRIRTNTRGEYDGVSICSAEDMYHDFSCYKPKDD
jgi:hypothetical protein